MASSKGNRPGFVDTLRSGWTPAQKRAGGTRSSARPVSAPKPARRRKGAARKNARAAASTGSPELVKRKDELSSQFAELQWDLGGIAYEMARRDHYRLEVLNAQAAKLQQVDAELGQIERMLKLDEAGAAGNCPSCGALQARGAMFCWQCGKEVKPAPPAPATPKPAEEASPKPAEETSNAATPKSEAEPKPESSGTGILRRSRSSKAED